MKYVLTDVAGENYRRADGMWSESADDAERFDFDAAKVRQEELLGEDCHTVVVETHGRSRKRSEAMVLRVSASLEHLEQQWEGKTIGIGFECDVEAGRMNIVLQPTGRPDLCLQMNLDVANILVGRGGEN